MDEFIFAPRRRDSGRTSSRDSAWGIDLEEKRKPIVTEKGSGRKIDKRKRRNDRSGEQK